MQKILLGNEAIARGAYEYGIKVATGYPGTPSTEILENIVQYPEIYAEWAPNEKVALEVGIGASIGGARTIVTMKHVGLNVAADPLLTAAYTGVNGGLVVLVADDPGMHSSQNEQDTRHYARLAKVPLLEPSDSQEAKEYIGLALEISEKFDTPVILRTTTRVAHSKSIVQFGERQVVEAKPYEKNALKYVMIPAYARKRHVFVEERMIQLADFAETMPANRVEWGDKKVGFITSGITYQYVKEVMPEASILKLAMVYPLPKKMIADFASQVDELYVVEELEPFIEEQLKAMGIKVKGKECFPIIGELDPQFIAGVLTGEKPKQIAMPDVDVPVRPPVLCPGCPHRGVFHTLSKMKRIVSGDIGCYTLGSLAPLNAMDTCICMGASIGGAIGLEKALPEEQRKKIVAVIGDSTFMHSGLTGLADVVYNGSNITTMILDNSTTAMTGRQDHPATGLTLMGKQAKPVNLEAVVKAIGIDWVKVVNPYNLKEVEEAIKEAEAYEGPAVIITRRPCMLIRKGGSKLSCVVNKESCRGCRACIKIGCPAMSQVDGKVEINQSMCNGCGVCAQLCAFKAIEEVGVAGE